MKFMKSARARSPALASLLLSAAGVVVLSAPISADAASCPPPSLSDCVDEAYLDGSCYAGHRSFCERLIDTEWTDETAASEREYTLLPDAWGGLPDEVSVAPSVEPVDSNDHGFGSQVGGLISANQALYRKGFKNLSVAEQAHANLLGAWAENGAKITSCQEYVHEKYLDYSLFEAETGVHGADYRSIFEHAYSDEGIVGHKLMDSEGGLLEPIFGEKHPRAKNAFFEFSPGPYPEKAVGYSFSSSAAQIANKPELREYYLADEQWHQYMSEALGNVVDDQLDELQGKQRDFETLLELREIVWDGFNRLPKEHRSNPQVVEAVVKELRVLDESIELALIDAEKLGCLDPEELTPCDWSPRLYADVVAEVMYERRQADLTACLELTGNDFSDSSFVRNAHLLKIDGLPARDYTAGPAFLDEYLEVYGGVIDSIEAPTDPSTGLSRRSGSFMDTGERGDRKLFAGAVAYGGDWEATWGSRFCDAEISFGGFATASAWVFGVGGEIAHLEGRIGTDDDHIELYINARFAGRDVFTNDTRHRAFLDFEVWSEKREEDAAAMSSTFFIWFIPVTVEAGLTVELGVTTRLGGRVTRDCAIDSAGLDVVGTLMPYAGLKTYASIAIGVPRFRVGIRGELTIAKVDVPLEASIGTYLSSSSELFLRLSYDLGLRQSYLAGRIKLFGELLFLKGSVTIASWSGIGGRRITLTSDSFDIPLASL